MDVAVIASQVLDALLGQVSDEDVVKVLTWNDSDDSQENIDAIIDYLCANASVYRG